MTSAPGGRCVALCVLRGWGVGVVAMRGLTVCECGLQLLEDLQADCRLTFLRISARSRPSPVIRRLTTALSAVCCRLEHAAHATEGILPKRPLLKRRLCHAQGVVAKRRSKCGTDGCDGGSPPAQAGHWRRRSSSS